MKFNCKECGQKLVCGAELSGESVKCPQCGSRIKVPESAREEKGDADAKKRIRRKAHAHGGQAGSDSTNVSMTVSGMLGLGFLAGFYLFMLPLRGYYLGDLFLARGWVPVALVFLTGWSVGFLLLKTLKISRQKNALLLDLLPESIAEEIDADNVEKFLDHVHFLPSRVSDSFMVNRIRKKLAHFAVRQSNPEVATMLMSQSDLDAASVSSSYAVVKVFIWAIPILGFIGTVLGISDAVGGFAGALDQAQDIEVLKGSLNEVTSGLAVAFDTTLVALVMSLLVSIPVSIIQKREEDFLGKVDDYCSENLLKRLNDAGGLADVAGNTKMMMQALGAAMAENQGDILQGVKDAQDNMAELHKEQLKYYEQLNQSMQAQVESHRESAGKSMEEVTRNIGRAVANLSAQLSALVENQVKTTSESAEQHQKKVAETLAKVAAPLDGAAVAYLEGLKEGLSSLNTVLASLGERQIVIRREPWWRDLFRKKAGSESKTEG
jgi:predicted transcriptional regulator/biopolymer transport protein ExbB/TolQ/DNA-directed RNA polymerase subunit RPC12/RpoP